MVLLRLCDILENESCVIKKFHESMEKKTRERLSNLGIFPETIVEVLANNHNGYILKAIGATYALSKSFGEIIYVERIT